MHWYVKIEHDRWRFAEYWLEWDEVAKTLTHKAEGQDNPKDLWGFVHVYPPKKLDDDFIARCANTFGQEVCQKIVELTGYTSEKK